MVDEPLHKFAERTLRMAADGYSGIHVLAVDAFLMGCTDKRSTRSALDRDPKTVDETVSLSWRSGKRARLTCVQLRVRASLRANVLSLENLNVIIRAIN